MQEHTHERKRRLRQPRASLPPGPDSHSLVQTYRYATNPLTLLDECARRFGDIFTLRLTGTGDWVVLSAPEDLRAMFTGAPEVLHAGEANKSVFGALTGGSTVFTLDETPHLRQRRLLLPSFHGERMQVYLDEIADIATRALARWSIGTAFPLHRETQRMTLEVIVKAVFGLDRGAEDKKLIRLLSDFANRCVGSPLLLTPPLQWNLGRYSPWGRILNTVRETDAALYSAIARRRETLDAEPRHDILSLILGTRDEDGRPLSDREIRDELVTTLMAGHETTGTALAWTFERILSLPAVRERVAAELDSVIDGERLEQNHLQQLDYLDAVIKETQRLRPIMPIGGSRKLTAPFLVGGYTVPAGATLTNGIYLLHRRPDLYPEPETFRPERFLGKRVSPYEWTPFGGGVRKCLGMAFALFEMKVILATVLSHARLRIVNPDARITRRGFFLVPEHGPRVVLQEKIVAERPRLG